jgi:hypothetical protein
LGARSNGVDRFPIVPHGDSQRVRSRAVDLVVTVLRVPKVRFVIDGDG